MGNLEENSVPPVFANRLNGDIFLGTEFLPTVQADAGKDRLLGGAGRDFFFASLQGLKDVLSDMLRNEVLRARV